MEQEASPLLNAIILIRNRLKVHKVNCLSHELPSDVISAFGKNENYPFKDQPLPTTSSASLVVL